jgi:hypothetical protein
MIKIHWHRGCEPGDEEPEPGDWYAEVDGTVVCAGSKVSQRMYVGRAVGIHTWGRTLNEFKVNAERYIQAHPKRIEEMRSQ